MSDSRTVTGHTLVMVKLANGGEIAVKRGEQLPEGLADGELDRLDKVGAFGPAREASLALQGASPAPGTVLPPQLTLAANPETGDGPLLPGEPGEHPLFSEEEIAEIVLANQAAQDAKARAEAAVEALREKGDVPADVLDRLVEGDQAGFLELLEHFATDKPKAELNVNPQAPPDPQVAVVQGAGVQVSTSSTNTAGPTPPPPPPAPPAAETSKQAAPKAAAPPKK